ncbi:MAG TPA: hypothetical protein VGN51_22855 [Acidimicrobiia bacterium]|jgi:Flp pilus assembly pilin Flp
MTDRHEQRGAVLVEFALVVTFLCLVVFAVPTAKPASPTTATLRFTG